MEVRTQPGQLSDLVRPCGGPEIPAGWELRWGLSPEQEEPLAKGSGRLGERACQCEGPVLKRTWGGVGNPRKL